jgi:O-antigen biosynthesis protein
MSNITSADFCFSAQRPRSINDSINIPFYIWAPDYRDSSGGIRVLHYLCHILNEIGEEAYLINTKITSPRLRTPLLTLAKLKQHFLAGQNPVTIYPEIISINPSNTPLIARWLLNIPGHLGNHIEFEPDDLIFYYEAWCVPDGLTGLPIFIHPVDHNFFNNNDNPDDNNRTHECYYANKYHIGKKPILKEHQGLVNLGQEIKRTHEEIAAILRKSKVLYCYEPSGLISEAQACGCPVVLIRSDYWPLPQNDTHHNIPGTAVYGEQNALEKARETLHLIPGVHAKARDNSWAMTKDRAESIYLALKKLSANGKTCKNETQELWMQNAIQRKDSLDKFNEFYLASDIYFDDVDSSLRTTNNYPRWLNQRTFIETDTQFLFETTGSTSLPPQRFHLIIRLPAGSESLLADTLDSLNQQVNSEFQLDIFSTSPSPAGLNELPHIDWRTIDTLDDAKGVIDFVVRAKKLDWVIELPPGARLDILFLWRTAYEIRNTPNATAFFCDDDCCNSDGELFNPRFKPGVNIAALQSTDLAGPICVRTDIWLASGGASPRIGSPWFSKLLQITDKSGWNSIKHIPDILITYLDDFPSSPESCHLALQDSLDIRGIEGEVRDVTPQSWGIRGALKNPPTVTIAILSTGQLEMVSRCLSSALKFTDYPAYELLIVTNKVSGDLDFDRWLTDIQTSSPPPIIRTVYVSADANHATRCNAAVASSESELVVLTREETVFVQNIWLEELVGSLQQLDIVAASPLIHRAGDAKILASGKIIGLLGESASPYSGIAAPEDTGYLDCLKVTRDSIALPSSCFLTRRSAYQDVGGMDEITLGDHFSDIDLCLKFRKTSYRLIVHPRSSVIFGGESSQYDLKLRTEATIKNMDARQALRQRWGADAVVDPYWNVNLSLSNTTPLPETEYRAQWQYLPTSKPRILAHPLGNGQGDYRVTSPLSAVRKAGLASECVWRQKITNSVRYFTAAEIARLAPTTVITQNYIHDIALSVLNDWNSLKNRPFIVYTLDDLINDLDKTNPFRKHIPPNSRSRLKYALTHCDRLVVSTDYLAESYRHFIRDIKVVPNRLEKDIWLPLDSQKQTSKKPRVGWAGGTTHEGDLILLKEIIEETREEVDWIFFGMCPDQIRPLLAEFHDIVPIGEYPAYLASLNLDIAVAPLAMSPFNQGKSNLRLLEYGVLGIPVVCTDIDPYRNSPACRVANSAKAWVGALRERIYDLEGREMEGTMMRDWVHRSYLLEDHLGEWLRAHLPS